MLISFVKSHYRKLPRDQKVAIFDLDVQPEHVYMIAEFHLTISPV